MIYERFKLVYLLDNNTKKIRLVGKEFYERAKALGIFGYIIFKNKVQKLKEVFPTKNLKGDKLEIKLIFHRLINDKSNMFENCQSLYSVSHCIIKKDIKILDKKKDKNIIVYKKKGKNLVVYKNNEDSNDNEVSNDMNLVDEFQDKMNENKTEKNFYNGDAEDSFSNISIISSKVYTMNTIFEYYHYLDSKEVKLKDFFKN